MSIAPPNDRDAFLHHKLRPPPCGFVPLHRLALQDRMGASREPVIWLNAPPGYGKTILMAQLWHHLVDNGHPAGWLNLDEQDNDLQRFQQHLNAALDQATGKTGHSPGHGTLFIDGIDRITAAPSLAFLAALLHHRPPGLRLFIASRGRPALRLAQLEPAGIVARFDATDLRFSPGEATELLQGHFTAEDIAEAHDRHAGWPFGLRAMLAGGPLRLRIADYLSENIMLELSPPDRALLEETSILDRLSSEAVGATLEDETAWHRLLALRERGLFALDDTQDGELRYHPVVRDFLRGRIAQLPRQRQFALHGRAARHFVEQQAYEDALPHAVAAQDLGFAATVLEMAGGIDMVLKAGPSILAPFSALSHEELDDYPLLALGVVYGHIQQADMRASRQLLDRIVARARQRASAMVPSNILLTLYDSLIRMMEDAPLSADAVREMSLCLATDAPSRSLLRTKCCNLLIQVHLDRDEPLAAAQLEDRYLPLGRGTAPPYLASFTRICAGVARMALGDLDVAAIDYREALEQARLHYGPDAVQVSLAQLLTAELLLERGKVAESRALILSSDDVHDRIHGWFSASLCIVPTKATVLAETQGPERALSYLDLLFEQAALRRHDRLMQLVQVCRVREATRAGLIDEASSAASDSCFAMLLDAEVEDRRLAPLAAPALIARHALDVMMCRPFAHRPALDAHIRAAGRRGLRPRLARLRLLRSGLHWEQGDEEAAIDDFRGALGLMMAMGALWPLVEHFGDVRQFMTLRWLSGNGVDPAERALVEQALQLLAGGQEAIARTTGETGVEARFSKREREVLALMARGMTTKEIARSVGLSPGTVKGYRRTMFEKLQVNTRSQAIVKGRQLSLLG